MAMIMAARWRMPPAASSVGPAPREIVIDAREADHFRVVMAALLRQGLDRLVEVKQQFALAIVAAAVALPKLLLRALELLLHVERRLRRDVVALERLGAPHRTALHGCLSICPAAAALLG